MKKILIASMVLINMAICHNASAAIIGTQAMANCGDTKTATFCNVDIVIHDPLAGTISANANRFITLTVPKAANLAASCPALSAQLGAKLHALYPSYFNMFTKKTVAITGNDRFRLIFTASYGRGNSVTCGGIF